MVNIFSVISTEKIVASFELVILMTSVFFPDLKMTWEILEIQDLDRTTSTPGLHETHWVMFIRGTSEKILD